MPSCHWEGEHYDCRCSYFNRRPNCNRSIAAAESFSSKSPDGTVVHIVRTSHPESPVFSGIITGAIIFGLLSAALFFWLLIDSSR